MSASYSINWFAVIERWASLSLLPHVPTQIPFARVFYRCTHECENITDTSCFFLTIGLRFLTICLHSALCLHHKCNVSRNWNLTQFARSNCFLVLSPDAPFDSGHQPPADGIGRRGECWTNCVSRRERESAYSIDERNRECALWTRSIRVKRKSSLLSLCFAATRWGERENTRFENSLPRHRQMGERSQRTTFAGVITSSNEFTALKR